MNTVWKYILKPVNAQSIKCPTGAKILKVGAQRGQLCVWMYVDTDEIKEERWFVILGTGHKAPTHVNEIPFSKYKHAGTALMNESGTDLVWHVFALETEK